MSSIDVFTTFTTVVTTRLGVEVDTFVGSRSPEKEFFRRSKIRLVNFRDQTVVEKRDAEKLDPAHINEKVLVGKRLVEIFDIESGNMIVFFTYRELIRAYGICTSETIWKAVQEYVKSRGKLGSYRN